LTHAIDTSFRAVAELEIITVCILVALLTNVVNLVANRKVTTTGWRSRHTVATVTRLRAVAELHVVAITVMATRQALVHVFVARL
jgi:hypothetical protein